MKASQNTLESLADIDQVSTAGQLRRIGAQMLLALARKELSATDLDAASKMLDSQANLLNAEVKVYKTTMDMRDRGGDIGKITHLGNLLIGNDDTAPSPANG